MTATQGERKILLSMCQSIRGSLKWTEHDHGLMTAWLTLADNTDLASAARVLKGIGARLSVITAFVRDASGTTPMAYLFDVQGSNVTLRLSVKAGESVESIVSLFRNADWLEREFMELYDIKVSGRVNTKRLFLDEGVDGQVMDRLIPLSVLANAASTAILFDRIKETQGDDVA